MISKFFILLDELHIYNFLFFKIFRNDCILFKSILHLILTRFYE